MEDNSLLENSGSVVSGGSMEQDSSSNVETSLLEPMSEKGTFRN